MKTLLIIVAIFIVIIGVLVVVTYPRYNREMRAAREHLKAESVILNTNQGEHRIRCERRRDTCFNAPWGGRTVMTKGFGPVSCI